MTYKMGAKGQVVVPKELRERHGLGPGDEVVFDDADGDIRIRRAKTKAEIIDGLRGALADPTKPPLTQMLVESRRRDREREDRKFRSFS
jgi:AbrB family looped-hinge helix DNA binding protein